MSLRYPMAIVSGAPKDEIIYTMEKNSARGYFGLIVGMHDASGKLNRLKMAIEHFSPKDLFFCDDRPSAIKDASRIKSANEGLDKIRIFGIIPPATLLNYIHADPVDWGNKLIEHGADDVFVDINDYSRFLLNGT